MKQRKGLSSTFFKIVYFNKGIMSVVETDSFEKFLAIGNAAIARKSSHGDAIINFSKCQVCGGETKIYDFRMVSKDFLLDVFDVPVKVF